SPYYLFRTKKNKVGDVSLKHRLGDSRLASVFGRKSENQTAGNTNCRPYIRSLSAIADATFW
ncbi:MAG: hypothetical protein LBF88_04055, partial [Planctomycetaceae bacterium]|nr:hypothetical protein [Planctomycetaceae bacterium]